MRAGRGLLMTGVLLAALGIVLTTGALWMARSGYTIATMHGAAMEPTYARGDRVPVERVDGAEIQRGDVVLYGMPGRYEGKAVLQRVIGLGGDRLAFDGRQLTRDGVPLREPYVNHGEPGVESGPYDVVVPAGRMFVLGDSRGNALDSRFFLSEKAGTVPTSAVQGRVLDSGAALILLGLAVVLGVLMALGGAVCVLVGWIAHRRRAVAPPFTPYAPNIPYV